MKFSKLNGQQVVVDNPITIKKNTYYPVLLNGSWQNVRAQKVSFEEVKPFRL